MTTKVKTERSKTVYLGGLRTFVSAKLTELQKDDTSDIAELWSFIVNRVGEGHESRIVSLETIYKDETKDECNCGCILEQHDGEDEEERISQPCKCIVSQGIVVFHHEEGATALRQFISSHNGLHPSGEVSRATKRDDGSVTMCKQCCFNNRRVQEVMKKPVAKKTRESTSTTDGEGQDFDIEEVEKCSEKQAKAAKSIMIAILGVGLAQEINFCGDSIIMTNQLEALKSIDDAVDDWYNDPDYAYKLPEISKETIKNRIRANITRLVFNNPDENQVEKDAFNWAKTYDEKDPAYDTVDITGEEDGIVVESTSPKTDEQKILEGTDKTEETSTREAAADGGAVPHTESTLPQIQACIEKVESILRTLRVQVSTTLKEDRDMMNDAANVKSELYRVFSRLSTANQDVTMSKFNEVNIELAAKIKGFQASIEGYELKEKLEKTRTEESKSKSTEDAPEDEEITEALVSFDQYYGAFTGGYNYIESIVLGPKAKDRRSEFEGLSSHQTLVEGALKNIDTLITSFKDWKKNSLVKAADKEEIRTRLQRNTQLRFDWWKLMVTRNEVENEHGFNKKARESGSVPSLIKKIEKFYGEEGGQGGHKWQNVHEWIRDIEMSIIRQFHDKTEQVYEVYNYLSPSIEKSARVEEFESWCELKEWLVKNYSDEARLVTEWQNRITTMVPKTLVDVPIYVAHTRAILSSVKSYCGGNQNLKEKIYSQKNASSLVKHILDKLSRATHRNEYEKFISDCWSPFDTKCKNEDRRVTPKDEFDKMDEFLDNPVAYAKSRSDMEKRINESELAGPEEQKKFKEPKFPRRFGQQNQSNSNGRGRTPKRGRRSNKKANFALVEIGNSKSSYENPRVVLQEVEKHKSNPSVCVLVTDDDLKKAKNWEFKRSKLTIACWVCNDDTPHEMWNCSEAQDMGNSERFTKARDKDCGPGTQCFSCLSSICFIERALKAAATNQDNSSQKQLEPCKNFNKEKVKSASCKGCEDEAKTNKDGLVKNQRPMHAVICPKKAHLDDKKVKGENITRMRKVLGSQFSKIRIQVKMPIHNKNALGSWLNNCNIKDKKTLKKTKKLIHEKLKEVSTKEYKGPDKSELLDPSNGSHSNLDLQNREILESIRSASPGFPMYFLQQLNLKGRTVLGFYDSGAMFHLIKSEVARDLDLKMTSRKSMYVVGAGNQVHTTGDGKYELVLGPGKQGEIYKLEVAGSREVTGHMLQADLRPVHKDVRDAARKLAEEGHHFMDENEALPLEVGGQKVDIIFGMTIPALQPKIEMCLPSGLLVATTKLIDQYGSRICFGGMYDNFSKFFQTHYQCKMEPAQLDEYSKMHKSCMQEYVNYRDSLRVDPVFFCGNRESNPDWQRIIDEENDEMAEDAPIIIAGSEEKRSVQLHRQQVLKQLINSGEKVVYQKKDYTRIETIEEYTTYPNRRLLDKVIPIVDEKVEKPSQEDFTKKKSQKNTTRNNSQFDILLQSSNTVSEVTLQMEERVNKVLGVSSMEYPREEGVYFANEASKIEYYNNLRADVELEDLMTRNTSLSPEQINVCNSKSGLATPFSDPAQVLGKSEDVVPEIQECLVDHGCLCKFGDVDLIFNSLDEEDLNVEEKKQVNKMKKAIRKWEDDETIGTGVDYRCSKCANCKDCLKSSKTRARSQREVDEQAVIESSVRIDWDQKKCYVYLPWIKSPQELALRWGAKSNLKQANHFLKKMLAKSPEDRASLTRFWDELKKRNVVGKLKDLDEDLQKSIMGSAVKHFYPWNCVFKESITTPCRMVVDSRTSGLNDHLAKGLNTLNNLQRLLLRFRSYQHIGSFDISKMYNMLYIEPSHLQYQLILWVDNMDPTNEVEVWVMLRAIYGTVSSGNQAEVAIRRGASELQKDYPEGAFTIKEETYVDDGVPCRDDRGRLKLALEQVAIILERIGFSLKCVTMSGQTTELSDKASSDGVSIGIAGYKYEPRADLLSLAMKECNFNKIQRGVKAPNKHPVVHGSDIDDEIFPSKITRAQALGKIAEMFDLIGLFMPLTVQGKIMARGISHLDWSDYVPEDQMKSWKELCSKIQDARHLKIRRCVIPTEFEAKDIKKVDLMEIHDGSKEGAATVVYVRSELLNGTFSTKMLFSRSSLCPVGQWIPRNELTSSHLGATAAYIAKVSVGDKVDKIYTFGDSYVAFLWVQNIDLKLKSWSFARVQDIKRLIPEAISFWVKGSENIADIATKGQITIPELDNESSWQVGLEWMHCSIDEIKYQETIKDFDAVMASLNAKDRADLCEEQIPSLPDLAAGARKNKNPEFDIHDFQTPSSILEVYRILQCYEVAGSLEDVPPNLDQNIGSGMDGNIDILTSEEPECIPDEFYKASYFGITAEEVVRAFITVPQNLSSFLVGRYQENQNEDVVEQVLRSNAGPKSILKDPGSYTQKSRKNLKLNDQTQRVYEEVTRHGWQKTFRVYSVMHLWRMKIQHKAHQVPTEGHHRFGKISPDQMKIRENLEKSCKICKKEKINPEGVNMGYLDSLCSGVAPEITNEEKIKRRNGNHDYYPKWNFKKGDKNGKAKEYWQKLSCYVTTRSGKVGVTPQPRSKKVKKKSVPCWDPETRYENIVEDIRIGDEVKIITWKYFMRLVSKKVTEDLTNKEKTKFQFDTRESMWKHHGRLLERKDIQYRDTDQDEFLDSTSVSYIQAVGMATDPIVFQIMIHLHWKVHPHKGVGSTNRILANIMYVVRGGYVVRAIRDECVRCRRILKKHIEDRMGDVPLDKLIVSPPFTFLQADTAGPFTAYSRHNQRSKVEVNALVLTCITTSAVSIQVVEDLDAPSIVKALLRHACRYGYPLVGYTDKGPGLKKGLNARVDLTNYELLIKKETGMRVVVKPTKSHEARGKVEKVVQSMKSYLEERKWELLTQSILDWETTFYYISNLFNNMPMGRLSTRKSLTFDVLEILTPNRLLLGRNNQRSPNFMIEEKGVTYNDRLSKNSKINKAWFTLLERLLPDLIDRPKWHKSSEIFPVIGDYVLFKHKESSAGKEHERWKVGLVFRIDNSESSPNSRIYHLEYRTAVKQKGKSVDKWKVAVMTTDRHSRELIILFTQEEIESQPGSKEHLARLEKKMATKNKQNAEPAGKARTKRRPKSLRYSSRRYN